MRQRISTTLVFASLCLWSLLALYPLFSVDDWYMSHERDRYFYLMREFRDSFLAGTFYPRWTPRLYNGFGYPTFLFYQPGFFYWMLPFTLLPLSLVTAFKAGLFCMFLLSALGCYRLARLHGADRFISACVSGLYLCMPYAYVNLYIRGDLSELLAMLLAPWVMVGVLGMRRELPAPVGWRPFLLYVAALAGVFLSHPIVALFVIIIIAWFSVVDIACDGIRSRMAWLQALGGVCAAVVTSPYWATVFQLAPSVRLDNAREPVHQLADWQQVFFHTDTIGGFSWAITEAGILNMLDVALAAAGLMLSFRSRIFWQAGPLLFLSVVMNSTSSGWLWYSIPGSDFVQFGWRIASVSGLLQYMGMLQLAAWLGRFSPLRRRADMAALVAVALFCQPIWTPGADASQPAFRIFTADRFVTPLHPWNPSRATGPFRSVASSFANSNEYTPRWVTSGALASCVAPSDDALLPEPDAGVTASAQWAGAAHIHGEVAVDAASFPKSPHHLYELPYVTVHQIYFPGWELRVNGETIRHAKNNSAWKDRPVLVTDDYGRMQVFFTHPGSYDVDLHYAGPPYWLARNVLMLLGMAALCFGAVRRGLVRAEIPFPGQVKKLVAKR